MYQTKNVFNSIFKKKKGISSIGFFSRPVFVPLISNAVLASDHLLRCASIRHNSYCARRPEFVGYLDLSVFEVD